MNEFLYSSLPISILFLFTLLVFPSLKNQKRARNLMLSGIFLALLCQTIFWLSSEIPSLKTHLEWVGTLNSSNNLLSFLILLFSFIFVILAKKEIGDYHSLAYFPVIFLLTISSLLLMIQSINLLVISFAFVVLTNGVYFFFFFGPYKKNKRLIHEVKELNNFIEFLILVLLIAMVLIYATYDLSKLEITFTSAINIQEYLLYFGYFLAFGLFLGIGPVFNFYFASYFSNASPLLIQFFTTVINTSLGLVFFRFITVLIEYNHILGIIFYFMALLGIIVNIVIGFKTYQKKQVRDRSKISQIIGLLSNLDFQATTLLLAIFYLLNDGKSAVYLVGWNYFLLAIGFNLLLNSIMKPVLDRFERDFSIEKVSIRPSWSDYLILFLFPGLFVLKYAPGYDFFQSLYQVILNFTPGSVLDSILMWSTLIIFTFLIAFRLYSILLLFNDYYHVGKNSDQGKQNLDKLDHFHLPVVIFFVGIILFILMNAIFDKELISQIFFNI